MALSTTKWSRIHDPFNSFSPEILETILAQILHTQGPSKSERPSFTLPLYLAGRLPVVNLYNAATASPILSRQLRYSRPKLVLDILRTELPGPCLQNAIAVLSFPDPQMGGLRLAVDEKNQDRIWNTNIYPDYETAVRKHMQRWAADDFPTTLNELGPAFVLTLESYLRRMAGYVEDYMWKAIGPPPGDRDDWTTFDDKISYQKQAWACVPDITSAGVRRFNSSPHATCRFHYCYLDEWRPFFDGFVQYELICLIHRPRPLKRALSSKRLPTQYYEGLPELPREWDFAYLEKLKRRTGAAARLWEVDRILSVFEYVASVYGAVFHTIIHEPKMSRPHDQWPFARQSIRDAEILTGHLVRPQSCDKWRFLDRLSMNGLGCLDNLLRGTMDNFKTAVRRFDMESNIAGIFPHPSAEDLRLGWGLYDHVPNIPNREVAAEGLYLWRSAIMLVTGPHPDWANINDRQVGSGMAREVKRSGHAFASSSKRSYKSATAYVSQAMDRMITAGISMTENAWIPTDNYEKHPRLFRATKVGHAYDLADGKLVSKRTGKRRGPGKKPMPACEKWNSDEHVSEFPSLEPYLKGLWMREADRRAFRHNRFMYGRSWTATLQDLGVIQDNWLPE